MELTGPAVATDEYAATELPSEGDELSMLVIVPEDGHDDEVQVQRSTSLAEEIDAVDEVGRVMDPAA